MFAADTYVIRMTTDEDARALRRLGELDSQPPLAGRALIGEIDGTPAAALSLGDGRVTADPFRRTEDLVAFLRVRAHALQAYQATPSLRERLLAALSARLPRRFGHGVGQGLIHRTRSSSRANPMPLTSLIDAQLVLTGPVRPRSMRERAHVARLLRNRRAARVAAGLLPTPAERADGGRR